MLSILVAVLIGSAGGPACAAPPIPPPDVPVRLEGPVRADAREHGGAEELSDSAKMKLLYSHLSAHRYSEERGPYLTVGPVKFYLTNHNVALLVAAGLVALLFGWLAFCRRKRMAPLGPVQNALELVVVFIRDEVVYKTMGEHHGRRFLPLFLTQFTCILVMNLFGVLPNFDFFRSMHFPTTATANWMVTAGLAGVTFTVMVYAGVREHGFGNYLVGLAPHLDLGASKGMRLMRVVILMILYPIEVIGLLIKPVALTVRLFANMTGGHLAMLTIYGLIYIFNSYLLGGVGVAFNVFLTFLELLIALIQAFIFTYLSTIFISASVQSSH